MWTGRGWLAGRPAGLRKARRIGERPSRNPLSARTHTPHSFLQYHKRKTLESLFSLPATQLPYQPIDHLSSRNAMRPRVGCRARPSSSTASPCSVVRAPSTHPSLMAPGRAGTPERFDWPGRVPALRRKSFSATELSSVCYLFGRKRTKRYHRSIATRS